MKYFKKMDFYQNPFINYIKNIFYLKEVLYIQRISASLLKFFIINSFLKPPFRFNQETN